MRLLRLLIAVMQPCCQLLLQLPEYLLRYLSSAKTRTLYKYSLLLLKYLSSHSCIGKIAFCTSFAKALVSIVKHFDLKVHPSGNV